MCICWSNWYIVTIYVLTVLCDSNAYLAGISWEVCLVPQVHLESGGSNWADVEIQIKNKMCLTRCMALRVGKYWIMHSVSYITLGLTHRKGDIYRLFIPRFRKTLVVVFLHRTFEQQHLKVTQSKLLWPLVISWQCVTLSWYLVWSGYLNMI